MTGTADGPSTPFAMVGAPDAMVCEGDVCFIPGASGDDVDIEPAADEAAAASSRAVTAALDEGANL